MEYRNVHYCTYTIFPKLIILTKSVPDIVLFFNNPVLTRSSSNVVNMYEYNLYRIITIVVLISNDVTQILFILLM